MIRFLCPLHGLIVAIRINGQISLLRDVNEIKSIMMENGIVDQIVYDTYLLNFGHFREIHRARLFVIY